MFVYIKTPSYSLTNLNENFQQMQKLLEDNLHEYLYLTSSANLAYLLVISELKQITDTFVTGLPYNVFLLCPHKIFFIMYIKKRLLSVYC